MKTDDFVLRPDYAVAVKDKYNIEAYVEKKTIDSCSYQIRISVGDKIAILYEKMKDGLTRVAILTIGEESTTYKKYHEAEEDAVAYLKG
jgi:hypothetical protein